VRGERYRQVYAKVSNLSKNVMRKKIA
jgi:hypothetical protein